MMFRIENITAGYGDITVLHGISLEIQKGEIVSLVGANAAGKSTLLRAISGLIPIDEGAIWFEDERIEQLDIKDRVAKGLIQIPEGRELFPGMSVQDNLLMGAFSKEHRKKANKNMEKVYELFPRLKERYKQMAGSLSGGEQQMVAIGRGLMSDPKLLMLDEPSLGLAPIVVQQMIQIIKKISEDMGTTIFLVEQNVNHALKLAKRGYVMENGNIVMSGSGQELLNNEHIKKAYLGI
ncbi:MAG: ABC transporter ATP-binding protein [Syntrophomonadaceae bacterium]|nr:ABC transporter ATP-binding protein [Syntrophomonadaceae bacterium]